jgi:hypothetical protein
MFDNLKTNDELEDEKDSLGGGSYTVNTDTYKLAADMAYFDKSKGGALSFNIVMKGQNGETVKQQWWVASGDAKGNKNYYTDKKGKNHYLPDFSAANNFCLLACGKEISELKTEEKQIMLYDFEERKEVPTKKQVAMEVLGKEVIVAVEKQIVDKTANDGSGNYLPTGETREQNQIVKSFSAKDNRSAAEIRAEESEALFHDAWVEKNKGNVNDMSTGVAEGGTDGAPGDADTAAGETKSLF